jgi:hypothetical protein
VALTEYIEDKLPGWMRKTPFAHFTAFAFTVSAVIDAVIEGVYDGRLGAMPGQVDIPGIPGTGGFESTDALPYIGRDRRIVRGFTESVANYAERLRKFRTSWRSAGTGYGILLQLQGILQPNPPKLRLVSEAGIWYTLDPDGTFTIHTGGANGTIYHTDGTVEPEITIAHPWDWDSNTFPAPPDKNDQFRLWIIIYVPTNPPLEGNEGVWGDFSTRYGDAGKVIGTTGTVAHTELLRGLANDWKAAGITISHFILAFDPDSFDPELVSPAPGMPDGYWGQHGRRRVTNIPDNKSSWIRSRNPTARYVRGLAGTGF